MTTTEIATRPAVNLAGRIEYSKTLAPADLLPPAFRGKPANILLAMDLADSLNRTAIEIMQQSQVISGKLTLSAEFMRSLVLASGHKIRVFMDGETAVAQGIRADDPEFTYEARWDMDRAKAAGLGTKDNWQNHPTAMLKARATTELCRDAFADVIHGIRSSEEAYEIVDVQPEPPSRLQAAVAAKSAAAEEVVEGELVVPDSEQVSQPQMRKMQALFKEKGFVDRDDRLAFVQSVVEIDVQSSTELTKDQASQVIDALGALSDVGAEPAS